MPARGLVVGFQFSRRVSYFDVEKEKPLEPNGGTGLLDGYRLFKSATGTSSVLVVFTDAGASHFFDIPLHEVFGQSLSPDHFFVHDDIRDVREGLESARTDNERIHVVERFLLGQMKQRQADKLVAGALYHIDQSKGTIRIAELAEILHTSQSPLEKRFRSIVGASPKKFAGIVRAQHIMEVLKNSDACSSEHLNVYYDQANFIKDFKKFSSLTPEQYLKLMRDQRK